MTGITRPITKHNFLVKKVDDLGRTIREAFHIARTSRPSPMVPAGASLHEMELGTLA